MNIHLSTETPDTSKHKCLVLGIFADERPPRGICGFIDWRLNGLISREIKKGRIAGDFAEKVIIPFPPRINSEILMLCGMGNTSQCSTKQIFQVAYQLIASIDKLQIDDFSFELPDEKRVNLSITEVAEAVASGFFGYLSRDAGNPNKITPRLLTFPEQVKEAAEGIKNFKSKIKKEDFPKMIF